MKSTKKKTSSAKTKRGQVSNAQKTAWSESLMIDKLPGYFLIVCLLLSLFALIYILKPFWTVLLVAAVLTIAFYPMYKKILKAFHGKKGLASLVSCLIVVVVLLAPLTLFVISLGGEAIDTYQLVNDKINSGVFDDYLKWEEGGMIYDLKDKVSPVIDFEDANLKESIVNKAEALSTYLFSQVQSFFASLFGILFSFLIILFSMFYFFRDGTSLIQRIGAISPLPSYHEAEFFKKTASMVKAIVFGVFLTAIAQGVVGGIGFAIAGISNVLFWGTAMAFFSLVPMIGTAIIWVPAAIILAILGEYGFAIFIGIWGVLAIGSVDNVLRPYLIGGKAHTYPLLTFFVILGAIWIMGLKGVIIGPLIQMILMAFLHIYESEYSPVLKN